jgi:hypothetical protein
MSAEPRTLKLNAGDLGGEGKNLRVAITNLMRGEREIVNTGQLTLGPYEAVALEVTGN